MNREVHVRLCENVVEGLRCVTRLSDILTLRINCIANSKIITMKNSTRKILTTVILITVISCAALGQTNVSGGIYTNTTWTLANSPYTVIDTVVVFPSVTLTIEPGVTVKFTTNKRIEIRDGIIIAQGTAADSVTFTSSSLTPYAGIYSGILLNSSIGKFNYCNFYYAHQGIQGFGDNNNDTLNCFNSYFRNNNEGIGPLYYINTIIDSCHFEYNDFGIKGYVSYNPIISNSIFNNNSNGLYKVEGSQVSNSSFTYNTGIAINTSQGNNITNCIVTNNDTAFYVQTSGGGSFTYIEKNIIENNNLGILLDVYNDIIICNKICNNTIYNLKYTATFSSNTNVHGNYWCTNDSSQIASTIYDGYDNINLGLVAFMPIDTAQCYLTTGIPFNESENLFFNIFPNPANENLVMTLPENIFMAEVKIYSLLGNLVLHSTINSNKTLIGLSNLFEGVYIIEVATGKTIGRQKFIKQKNIR